MAKGISGQNNKTINPEIPEINSLLLVWFISGSPDQKNKPILNNLFKTNGIAGKFRNIKGQQLTLIHDLIHTIEILILTKKLLQNITLSWIDSLKTLSRKDNLKGFQPYPFKLELKSDEMDSLYIVFINPDYPGLNGTGLQYYF